MSVLESVTKSVPVICMAGSLRGGEHAAHQLRAAELGQHLVEVAALGRLDAGGAARLAGALADEPVRVVDERLEGEEPAPRDADPARMAVVDEDGRAARLRVQVG